MHAVTVVRWSVFVPGFGFGPLAASPVDARNAINAAMLQAYCNADPAERGSIEEFLGRAVDRDQPVLVQVLAVDVAQLAELEQELDLVPRGAR